MSNVIRVLDNTKADQDVVDELRQLLAEAEAGRVLEFAAVARLTGGVMLTTRAGSITDAFAMFGALTHAAHEYGREHID